MNVELPRGFFGEQELIKTVKTVQNEQKQDIKQGERTTTLRLILSYFSQRRRERRASLCTNLSYLRVCNTHRCTP